MPFRGSSIVSDTDTTATDGDSLHQVYRGGDKVKHRRTSRACDQCRKTKSRCDHAGDSSACRSCVLSDFACTFLEPSQKRGPPKGYLSALEGRLHEAEALLGVIISTNDMRAQTLVSDLAKDSLANTIIKRVKHSVFGPVGRETLRVRGAGGSCDSQGVPTSFRRPTDSRRQQMNSREVAMGDDGNLMFTTPSNIWQDYLIERLATEATYTCVTFSNMPTVTRIEIPEHSPFHHMVESADGHGETSASKDGSEPRTASSEDDMSSSHSSFSRHTSDGNLGSNLSGIPSGQWPPSSDPVFGEQDQNQFSTNLCLEGAYTYGRRSISENYPKDTNSNGENYLTSEGHTIPRNSTSVTHQGGWTDMLSHEAHHSSRLFGQTQFVDSGIDLNNME